jgi:hypothetical protein
MKSIFQKRGVLGVLLFLSPGLLFAANAPSPALEGIKTVYLMPMASGLDQFLAVRLTTGSILEVVTDPQKADGILTGRIGASFEQQFEDLYAVKPSSKDDKDNPPQLDYGRAPIQPMSRGKGAIFLVDRKTRAVLWSTYALPKNTAPGGMNQLAERIAARLDKDRKGK